MIIETTINLKNKSKEELILLLNESLGVIKKLQKENEELENKHECTTYIKYQEHYQITPMTWYYRDSFKCIECGKDWKD